MRLAAARLLVEVGGALVGAESSVDMAAWTVAVALDADPRRTRAEVWPNMAAATSGGRPSQSSTGPRVPTPCPPAPLEPCLPAPPYSSWCMYAAKSNSDPRGPADRRSPLAWPRGPWPPSAGALADGRAP